MEVQYRNMDINFHLEKDSPEVRLEGFTNMGSTKANWIQLTIAGVVISVFTPSQVGVEYLLESFKKPHSRETLQEQRSLHIKQEYLAQESIQVEITSYNAEVGQTDSTPTICASGATVAEDICALSRDIEREYGLVFGDIIHIEGYGEFSFQDRMNKRIVRGVDIFRWNRADALEIGRRPGRIFFTSRTLKEVS